MADYKKIAEEALRKAKLGVFKNKTLNESIVYPEGMSERMHPDLEKDLLNRTHSLGNHPIFPETDESTFEEKIMGERFNDVAKRYKRAYECDTVDPRKVMSELMPLVNETMAIESRHKTELEELAKKMIREEYNMDESIVEIHAELTPIINMMGTKKNPKPMANEIEFDDHDSMVSAKDEVYKRRFLNAMTQGAAKKCNHMFHMVEDELTDLDPKLPNKYSKMMAGADYAYYTTPRLEDATNGGVVRVQFPTKDNPKAVIYAQAMVFPVLIHELVKGVMELLSAHGLPKGKELGEYVINKADFLAAEPWDMRIGPGLWERFTKMFEADDFPLKHHVYSELAALPVAEFNMKMREIMAGTKVGKKIISDIVDEIKSSLQQDDFNEAINAMTYEEPKPIITNKPIEKPEGKSFTFDELISGDDEEEDSEEGFNLDELL